MQRSVIMYLADFNRFMALRALAAPRAPIPSALSVTQPNFCQCCGGIASAGGARWQWHTWQQRAVLRGSITSL